MHRKIILLLILCTTAVFASSLNNKFVGDDFVTIVNNNFYKNPSNISKLFTNEYITTGDVTFGGHSAALGSGEVSYRPVKSFIHFIEYRLFGLNPFGYHTISLLFHIANVIAVYFLLFMLGADRRLACLTALIFALHPIQSETVCSINYRHGLMANLFTVLSMISYLRWRQTKKSLAWICLLVFYGLAVFSKESSVVLPAIFLLYDFVIEKNSVKQIIKTKLPIYYGLFLITVLYLYIYLFVFPNSTFGQLNLIGGSLAAHLAAIGKIFSWYAADIIYPLGVNMLPPQFVPAHESILFWKYALAIIAILLLGFSFKENRRLKIFLFGWVLLTLLPVSNIITLANPMAFRFLYSPMVGISFFLGCFVLAVWDRRQFRNMNRVLLAVFMLCFALYTIHLNTAWKDPESAAKRMIVNNPQNPYGYLFLAQYHSQRDRILSQHLLDEAFDLSLEDPRGYTLMGILNISNYEKIRPYYETCLRKFKNIGPCYAGLGRVYLLTGKYEQALPILLKAKDLSPSYSVYGYLMQTYIYMKRYDEAEKVLQEGLMRVNQEGLQSSLKRFWEQRDQIDKPIDIGL